jgi:predicted lipoprotein
MKKYLPWIVVLVLVAAFIAVLPFSVTIVPIAEVEAQKQLEEFDPVAYVEGIWSSQILPAVTEKAVDLAAILNQFEVDAQGRVKKEQITAIARGKRADHRRRGARLSRQGRGHGDGGGHGVARGDIDPAARRLRRADHGAALHRAAHPQRRNRRARCGGLYQFGDFRDQTEYGKVASELNKRIASEVLGGLDVAALAGKRIAFYGALGIRTFNLIDIDVSTLSVVPIQLEVVE